ncbi:MAG: RDD family protein [Streptosporangiaceae bacterium]
MRDQAVRKPASDPPDHARADGYPGKRFGLPEDGPRSVAGIGRRLGALIIDWLACLVIAMAAFQTQTATQLGTYVLFGAEVWLLTALTGFTLGKRILGIRVARTDGKPVGLVMGLLRTVLLLLVVPPLVLDKDLRGLHDRAARTVVIRL